MYGNLVSYLISVFGMPASVGHRGGVYDACVLTSCGELGILRGARVH